MKYIYRETWKTPSENLKVHKVLNSKTELDAQLKEVHNSVSEWKNKTSLYEEVEATYVFSRTYSYKFILENIEVLVDVTEIKDTEA